MSNPSVEQLENTISAYINTMENKYILFKVIDF